MQLYIYSFKENGNLIFFLRPNTKYGYKWMLFHIKNNIAIEFRKLHWACFSSTNDWIFLIIYWILLLFLLRSWLLLFFWFLDAFRASHPSSTYLVKMFNSKYQGILDDCVRISSEVWGSDCDTSISCDSERRGLWSCWVFWPRVSSFSQSDLSAEVVEFSPVVGLCWTSS